MYTTSACVLRYRRRKTSERELVLRPLNASPASSPVRPSLPLTATDLHRYFLPVPAHPSTIGNGHSGCLGPFASAPRNLISLTALRPRMNRASPSSATA